MYRKKKTPQISKVNYMDTFFTKLYMYFIVDISQNLKLIWWLSERPSILHYSFAMTHFDISHAIIIQLSSETLIRQRDQCMYM